MKKRKIKAVNLRINKNIVFFFNLSKTAISMDMNVCFQIKCMVINTRD